MSRIQTRRRYPDSFFEKGYQRRRDRLTRAEIRSLKPGVPYTFKLPSGAALMAAKAAASYLRAAEHIPIVYKTRCADMTISIVIQTKE